jgi:hypothetical protein
VRPSFPRVKLWDDSMQALDIPADGVPQASSGKRKFHFCDPDSFDPSPVRLRGVYVLDRSMVPERQAIRPKSGADAATLLSREIYRRPIGFHVGRKTALLTEALHIAGVVPVFQFPILSDLAQIGTTAARVETHFKSLGRDRSETVSIRSPG